MEELSMKSKLGLGILAMLVTLVFAGTPAYAQATRTWVSGVGDDANPCSRTAPCKTFAGAISKTASGGEINVLDPGGFGGVTITKPITISSEGFEAGVLVSGTNAIIVNVPNAADVVVLRGLDIEGLGTGLSGITVLTGGNVQVDKCTIDKFTVSGINFAPTVANSQLHVVDSIIRNNGKFTAPTSGQGVLVSGTTTRATLDNVRLEHNVAGLVTAGSSISSVSQSVSAGNMNAGFVTTGTSILTIERSVSTNNGTGVVCNASTTVRIGNMSITNNGAAISAGGACTRFGNNDSDASLAAFTFTAPQ
jgi:hypothetical protein